MHPLGKFLISLSLAALIAGSCIATLAARLGARGAPATAAPLERHGQGAGEPPATALAGVSQRRQTAVARSANAARSARQSRAAELPDFLRGARPEAAYGALHALTLDAEAAAAQRDGLRAVAESRALDPELRGLAVLALARAGDLSAAEAALAPDRPEALRETAAQVIRLARR